MLLIIGLCLHRICNGVVDSAKRLSGKAFEAKHSTSFVVPVTGLYWTGSKHHYPGRTTLDGAVSYADRVYHGPVAFEVCTGEERSLQTINDRDRSLS